MPYAPRKYTRKSKKPASFAKRVRKVISAAAQLKHATNNAFVGTLSNDTLYFTLPTQNIARGTSINERVGDQVKLKYLKINGFFSASTAANANVKLRVSVFYSADGRSASSVTSGAFSAQDLFHPNTFGTPATGIWDEKALTVLADMTIDLNSNVSTSQEVKSFAFTVPLKNAVCNFKESGSAFSLKRNIYVVITGHTPVSANVLNLGQVAWSYDLGFNDI